MARLSKATVFLTVVILAIDALIFAKLFIPQAQMRALAQFHLREEIPFSSWALAQTIPSMYNFANEFYWARFADWNLLPPNPYGNAEHTGEYRWLNHYPLRLITFTLYRQNYARHQSFRYCLLRSRFRGQALETVYEIHYRDGQMVVQRLNPP